MESQKNTVLFENKVSHIIKDRELLYKVEEILKYFSKNIVHIDPLIQNLKKIHPSLHFKVIKNSSSTINYYVDTKNALKLIMNLDTSESILYKDWIVKCAVERMNEIIDPKIIYDRLKTILYNKGIKSPYTFMKSELDKLNNKESYVELDQKILNEDIKSSVLDLNPLNNSKISVVKLPRESNSTIIS